jgi:uncharacterized protein (DUF2342 family)
MAIERIGTPPAAQEVGTARTTATGQGFDVSKPTAPQQASSIEPSSRALEELRIGRVDVNGYVELKVDEATAHLAALPRAQLDAIRDALRDRLTNDPSLAELVRAATGGAPQPRDPGDG